MQFKFLLFSLLIFNILAFGLSAQNRTITGKVVDAKTNEPLPGVNVALAGSTIGGTVTDANGNFTLQVVSGQEIVFSYVGYKTDRLFYGNQNNFTIALDVEDKLLNDIVIVGSRNANRTELDTPVPVDVIDIKNLQKAVPQYDVNQMLTYLAPSFQSNRQSSSDGTEHIDPASLRGLGPDQTLVLINGKRRHTTSLLNNQGTFGNGSVGTDLNTIPAIAIERIEVLRDGASAQYGSDAIAGVINIVLKRNTNQLNVSLGDGITSRGDGRMRQVNFNYGFDIGKKGGFFNLTGELYTRGNTNRTQNHDLIIFDQSAQGNFFAYPFTDNPVASRAFDDNILKQRGLTRDDFDFRVGDAAINNATAFYNFSLPFGKDGQGEIYSFAGLSYRDGFGNGFRRLPSQTSNVNLDAFPNGFQPNTLSRIWDKSLAVGLRYRFANDWRLDFSNTYGNNSFDYRVTNTNNASQSVLNTQIQTQFEAGGHEFRQNTLNLDISKYFKGIASGMNLAFGGEYRLDNYRIRAGEEASWRNYGLVFNPNTNTYSNPSGLAGGSQSFPGYSPLNVTNQSRNNLSFYTDLELEATQNWTISGAARFERYSDFGNTLNGKLATRYAINQTFALRGAISTGFRAPSLHQQYFSYVSTNLLNDGQLGQSGFFQNESAVAKVLGIPKLKQETSTNYSLGVTISPSNRLRITVDGYYIRIKNRITLTGGFGQDEFGDPVEAIQDILAPFEAKVAQFFTNSVNMRARGLDVVATYNLPLGSGKLDISLAANFNKITVDDQLNVPNELRGQELIYFSPAERGLIERVNPRQKINLTLNYQIKKWSFMLRNTYFGEAYRNGFPFGVEQTFAGKTVTDLSISYDVNQQINFAIGANNLLDVFPDEQAYANSYLGVFKYAPVQMGSMGTFYFARLNLKLATK
ncbi:MAG: TonB-dependent receptor [Microscillaceae bacterium]|jgi:iron complex outermembrane receptor protein|nr:TonB-dependent receptor [Microscillaceae bacterium]